MITLERASTGDIKNKRVVCTNVWNILWCVSLFICGFILLINFISVAVIRNSASLYSRLHSLFTFLF